MDVPVAVPFRPWTVDDFSLPGKALRVLRQIPLRFTFVLLFLQPGCLGWSKNV
jgi:hypothetical protein